MLFDTIEDETLDVANIYRSKALDYRTYLIKWNLMSKNLIDFLPVKCFGYESVVVNRQVLFSLIFLDLVAHL